MSAIREGVTSHPLYWPTGWERAKSRTRANFRRSSVYAETQEVLAELDRMGVPDWNVIVSTNLALRRDGLPYSNQKTPTDPGAAVWFDLRGEERVLACDRWDLVEHNLRAIAKHVAALRGQDRWGVGSLEQAFRGFTALPSGLDEQPWREVLGFRADELVSPNVVRSRFRDLALANHPDQGGNADRFQRMLKARAQAIAELGGSRA